MKFEVGKMYKVKDETNQINWNSDGCMEKYIGTNIELIEDSDEKPRYKCKCYDGETWYFNEEDLEEINPTFSKSDMLNGYVCELRNGDVGVWINGTVVNDKDDYTCYNDDLTDEYITNQYDIIKVSDCYGKVIWERVEDINKKQWRFIDSLDNKIRIAPNNPNGYDSSNEPILFDMREDDDDDSALIGLSIDQAKQIISALTEIVEFVENEDK